MPLAARLTIITSVSALLAGAAYLLMTRGPAILIDLSSSISQMLCL